MVSGASVYVTNQSVSKIGGLCDYVDHDFNIQELFQFPLFVYLTLLNISKFKLVLFILLHQTSQGYNFPRAEPESLR